MHNFLCHLRFTLYTKLSERKGSNAVSFWNASTILFIYLNYFLFSDASMAEDQGSEDETITTPSQESPFAENQRRKFAKKRGQPLKCIHVLYYHVFPTAIFEVFL